MSRYIDADAWWEEVQKLYTDGDCADKDRYKLGINVGITASRGVMFNLPTIDAIPIEHINLMNLVEVVRCKECKHWWNEYGDSACMLHSDFTVNADDYCSYGEREGE